MSGTIVWFRNDLRLDDQPAVLFAAAAGEPVVPVYCWHPSAAGRWAPGGASRWWLHRSLQSLQASLQKIGSRLIVRAADPATELIAIAKVTGATAVNLSLLTADFYSLIIGVLMFQFKVNPLRSFSDYFFHSL